MKQSQLSWIKFAWNDEIFLSLWLFLFSIALVVLTIWATFLGERINHNNLGAIYYNMLLSRFDSQIQIAEIEVALLKDKSIETPNFIINKTYNTYLDFINTDISAPNFRIAPEQTVIKKQVNSFEELKVLIDKNILATRATEFDQLQLSDGQREFEVALTYWISIILQMLISVFALRLAIISIGNVRKRKNLTL